jgi:hypothetical protein
MSLMGSDTAPYWRPIGVSHVDASPCKVAAEVSAANGKAARFLWSAPANFGKRPLEVYVVGLRLWKEEW